MKPASNPLLKLLLLKSGDIDANPSLSTRVLPVVLLLQTHRRQSVPVYWSLAHYCTRSSRLNKHENIAQGRQCICYHPTHNMTIPLALSPILLSLPTSRVKEEVVRKGGLSFVFFLFAPDLIFFSTAKSSSNYPLSADSVSPSIDAPASSRNISSTNIKQSPQAQHTQQHTPNENAKTITGPDILQLNIDDVQNKNQQIQQHILENNILIVVIQKTNLKHNIRLHFSWLDTHLADNADTLEEAEGSSIIQV